MPIAGPTARSPWAAGAHNGDAVCSRAGRRRRYLEHTWLLVYDNVTAPDHIADLLPAAGARVLITSRFSDWRQVADEVPLDVLPLDEAIALLESRTGRKDAEGARTLAEALGNLPLAFDHAAAYCKRTQMRFADYAKKASSLIATAPRGVGYPRSVAATFDFAIKQAVAQCQAAEPLMAYLAQCAPERIPMTLVEGAVEDEAQLMEALTGLAEVSLVKHDPFEDGTLAVTVHRLVQAVARARSQSKRMTQAGIDQMIGRLATIYPKNVDNPHSWPLCAKLTPHLLARRRPWRRFGGCKLVRRFGPVGRLFLRRAAFSEALALLRDALATNEMVLGPDGVTPGPRKAPVSLPTRSTRLAVPRGRRRCASGTASRVLTTPSAHEPLPGIGDAPRGGSRRSSARAAGRRAIPARHGWALLTGQTRAKIRSRAARLAAHARQTRSP
jgi:hypothetical protein